MVSLEQQVSIFLILAILPLIIAVHTWVMILLKMVSKNKAINFFTWMMLLASTGLYFKMFGDQAHKDFADIWYIGAISYLFVFGPEEWGRHDQINR